MTIRYRNTFRDIMAFCFYHYPRSPVVIGFYGIGFAMISLLIFQTLPKDADAFTKVFVFAIMEFLAFSLIAVVFGLSVVLSMVSGKNKTVLTEHTITLADDSFIEETAYSRTEHKWPVVQKLARTRNHLFIYVAQYSAHVVPRRAFNSDAEWEAFYGYCSKKVEANP